MKVVGNVTAAPKGDKPTLNKQIKHNENGEWGVVGDNQIGDTVEFRTITKVPNTSGYTKYDYIIHDTMSAGLTSKAVHLKIQYIHDKTPVSDVPFDLYYVASVDAYMKPPQGR